MLERTIKPDDKEKKENVMVENGDEEKKDNVISFPLRNERKKTVKERMIDNSYSFTGDGNGDDSIGDTLHIEGPLSLKDQNYLRTVSAELQKIDVSIQRAEENGNPELAYFMAKQWESKRNDLIIYLKKNNIRICPMKQKNKEKIWNKAEEQEARQEKKKTNVYLKNRDHGYGRERIKNYE